MPAQAASQLPYVDSVAIMQQRLASELSIVTRQQQRCSNFSHLHQLLKNSIILHPEVPLALALAATQPKEPERRRPRSRAAQLTQLGVLIQLALVTESE